MNLNISDPATVRDVGTSWVTRKYIFLYYSSKGRKINKEIYIRRWFSDSLRCHNHLLLMHLLDRSKTTSKTQQTQHRYQKIKWLMPHTRSRRFSANSYDVNNFHLLLGMLFAIDVGECHNGRLRTSMDSDTWFNSCMVWKITFHTTFCQLVIINTK